MTCELKVQPRNEFIVIIISEGICQSYVSRYMKGDIYDMSERSRHAILKWYLIYRKNPAAIGEDLVLLWSKLK